MLDGVDCSAWKGGSGFHEARASTAEELQALLFRIITRILKLLTRQCYLIEEEGLTYVVEGAPGKALTALQAASCTYRIALGPRAREKIQA